MTTDAKGVDELQAMAAELKDAWLAFRAPYGGEPNPSGCRMLDLMLRASKDELYVLDSLKIGLDQNARMILDHLDLLPAALAPHNMTGHLSLCRTVLDLGARMLYSACIPDDRERLRRAINEIFYSQYEQVRMYQIKDDKAEIAAMKNSIFNVIKVARRLGFKPVDKCAANDSCEWKASYILEPRPTIFELWAHFNPAGPDKSQPEPEPVKFLRFIYAEGCAIHGGWHLARFMQFGDTGAERGLRAQQLRAVHMMMMFVAAVFGDLYGWRPEDFMSLCDRHIKRLVEIHNEGLVKPT